MLWSVYNISQQRSPGTVVDLNPYIAARFQVRICFREYRYFILAGSSLPVCITFSAAAFDQYLKGFSDIVQVAFSG
jgi:hypothetical protein